MIRQYTVMRSGPVTRGDIDWSGNLRENIWLSQATFCLANFEILIEYY